MSNNYTELFADTQALTAAELRTAYQTLTPDIANTTQMTTGSTTGTFLKSNGSGLAASFAAVPDVLGPFAIRNYGLNVIASANNLVISLKDNAAADPSGTSAVDVTFSTNGATSATYSALQVTAPLSLTVVASASLGLVFTSGSTAALATFNTAASRVYIYAINNSSVVQLAASLRSDLDNGTATTTVALSTTADDASVLYASSAISVVPRLLGWANTAISSTGNWQTPTNVSVTNTLPKMSSPQISATGALNTTSTSYIDAANLSVQITTTGRPVICFLMSSGASAGTLSSANYFSTSVRSAYYQLLRDSTTVGTYLMYIDFATANTGLNFSLPSSSLYFIDTPVAGTYTYKIQGRADFGTAVIANSKLVVYEL